MRDNKELFLTILALLGLSYAILINFACFPSKNSQDTSIRESQNISSRTNISNAAQMATSNPPQSARTNVAPGPISSERIRISVLEQQLSRREREISNLETQMQTIISQAVPQQQSGVILPPQYTPPSSTDQPPPYSP